MAWTALENALAASVALRGTQPLEMIRHAELIPLGRAMFALADSARNRRLPKRETLETQLRAIRYLESEVSLEYGRVPWRVLPAAARGAFLKSRPDMPCCAS